MALEFLSGLAGKLTSPEVLGATGFTLGLSAIAGVAAYVRRAVRSDDFVESVLGQKLSKGFELYETHRQELWDAINAWEAVHDAKGDTTLQKQGFQVVAKAAIDALSQRNRAVSDVLQTVDGYWDIVQTAIKFMDSDYSPTFAGMAMKRGVSPGQTAIVRDMDEAIAAAQVEYDAELDELTA